MADKRDEADRKERDRQLMRITGAGAPRKYATAKALERAVQVWFSSISRMEQVTAPEWNGRFTQKGKPIMEPVPVRWPDGTQMTRLVYLVPPTEEALCIALGISLRTWENYQDEARYPGYNEVIQAAKLRIRAWNLEQMLIREKGLQGLIFNLSANYGLNVRHEVELGRETRRAMSVEGMSMDEKLALIRRAAEAAAAVSEDAASGETDEETDGE